jgi:hypothetical protein
MPDNFGFQPASDLGFKPNDLGFKPTEDLGFKPEVVGARTLGEEAKALPSEYMETEKKNREALKDSLYQTIPDTDLISRGAAALDIFGSAVQYAFTPLEVAGRYVLGDPIEAVTKVPGLAKNIGQAISDVGFVATDPVMLATKAAKKVGASELGKSIEGAVSPSTTTPEAANAGSIIRSHSGTLAMDTSRAANDLEQFRAGLNKLPEDQRFAFMDSIETGAKQASPELDGAAAKIRKMLDDAKAKVQSLGKGYLEKSIENYFPHIWKDPKRAQQVSDDIEQEMARMQSRRPIQGQGSFLKQRTVETIAQGRARGLELLTTDPIELTLIKIREMNKFYHGTLMADELKNSGLAQFVKSTEKPPVGWVKLDDKVFTARAPSAKIAEETGGNQTAGITHFGDWYAPEEVARVFNNYVGQGLSGRNALFDMVRHAGNSINLLQLGISGFHATMTTLDTTISNGARTLENVSHGEFGEAAKNIIGVTPIGAFTTGRAGAKLRKAALTSAKETLTPEMQKLVEGLEKAGGRLNMDSFYRATDENGLIRSLKNGSLIRSVKDNFKTSPYKTVLKTPFDIAQRAISDISAPLMEWLVPRYKLGVFSNLASDFIRRNPNATPEEFRVAMQTIWDSVDNRLGQMVYDNVFWNKTGKDLAFIMFRSVGWNLGTVRELGGGVFDSAKAISALRTGDKAEFTHRMAYSIALPAIVALNGAIITYLYTGHGPQEIVDYFYPPTGGTTPQGYPERVSIPNYTKDILQYNRAPVQTVLNKLNPVWAVMAQLYQNRDFYGGIIANPDDPVIQQAQDVSQYIAEQFTPFSIRGAERLSGEGATPGQEVGSFFGFQPAPGFITNPEAEINWQERQNKSAIKKKARENQ